MKINQKKCIQYSVNSVCPKAIIKNEEKIEVDYDECVECNICYYSNVCTVDAFEPADLKDELRAFRNTLSDPLKTHKDTNVLGRGTEEMKTNDVTGNLKPGYVGIGIEMGRPGTGTRFYDVQKVARACAQYNVKFAKENPVTTIMKNKNTGDMKGKYLKEKTLLAIVEFTLPIEELEDSLRSLEEVSKEVKTVFSVEVISKVNNEKEIPGLEKAENYGYDAYPNGKVNVGLGRPRYNFGSC